MNYNNINNKTPTINRRDFLKLSIAGIGTVISGTSTYVTSKKLSEIELELLEDPNYIVAEEFNDIISLLKISQNNLKYTPATTTPIRTGKTTIYTHIPEKYPNTAESKKNLEIVFSKLHSINLPNIKSDKNGEIDTNIFESLQNTYNQLPDEEKTLEYQGKSVNRHTFNIERSIINKQINEIQTLKHYYLDKIPEKLLNEKTKYQILFGGSLGGFFGSILAGIYIYTLNKKR